MENKRINFMEKFKFNVDEVLAKLALNVGIVPTKPTMPIFSKVWIKKRGEEVSLTTSDGEMWLTMPGIGVSGDPQEINLCLNANDFYKALSNLKGEVVEIVCDGERKSVVCKYTNGEFTLPCDVGDEFPLPSPIEDKEQKTILLDGEVLYKGLRGVEYAMGDDALRPVLSGARLDFTQEGLFIVATNGHKLTQYKDTNNKMDIPWGLTLPKKTSTLLKSILQDSKVGFTMGNGILRIEGEGYTITTRLLEGAYPNYRGVIPNETPNHMTIKRERILQALKRMSLFAKVIRLKIGAHEVVMDVENLDMSTSAHEVIPCAYDGEALEIGFNGEYLLEVISNIDGENIVMHLISPNKPCVFTPQEGEENIEHKAVLTPMVLKR